MDDKSLKQHRLQHAKREPHREVEHLQRVRCVLPPPLRMRRPTKGARRRGTRFSRCSMRSRSAWSVRRRARSSSIKTSGCVKPSRVACSHRRSVGTLVRQRCESMRSRNLNGSRRSYALRRRVRRTRRSTCSALSSRHCLRSRSKCGHQPLRQRQPRNTPLVHMARLTPHRIHRGIGISRCTSGHWTCGRGR